MFHLSHPMISISKTKGVCQRSWCGCAGTVTTNAWCQIIVVFPALLLYSCVCSIEIFCSWGKCGRWFCYGFHIMSYCTSLTLSLTHHTHFISGMNRGVTIDFLLWGHAQIVTTAVMMFASYNLIGELPKTLELLARSIFLWDICALRCSVALAWRKTEWKDVCAPGDSTCLFLSRIKELFHMKLLFTRQIGALYPGTCRYWGGGCGGFWRGAKEQGEEGEQTCEWLH